MFLCLSHIGAHAVHPIAMKLSEIVVNMLAVVLKIYNLYKNHVCVGYLCVCVCVPYRSIHRSSDCDGTFTSCCKHARGGSGNINNL